jgi:hypothetical protein
MLINFKLDTGKESNKKDLRLIYEIKFKMANSYLSIYDFFHVVPFKIFTSKQ